MEQNDPRPKGAGKIQRKLNKVRFKSRPRKQQRPMPQEDEETNPTIVVSSDEDGQKDQEEEHTREEEPPQSPPEEEKGNLPYSYTPKSPLYPPPEDNDWETKSLPRLVTPDEDQDSMTPREGNPQKCQPTKMLIRTFSRILKDSQQFDKNMEVK